MWISCNPIDWISGKNSVIGAPSELAQGDLHPANREDSRDPDHCSGERPSRRQRAQVRTVLHRRRLHWERRKVKTILWKWKCHYKWLLYMYLEELSKEIRIRMLIVFSDYFYSEDLSKEIRIKMIVMEENRWRLIEVKRHFPKAVLCNRHLLRKLQPKCTCRKLS